MTAAPLFALWTRLLAVALLLDQLWWGGFEWRSAHVLVVVAAAAVLVRPVSVRCVVGLLVAVAVSVGRDLPVVGSHRLLELAVSGGTLVWLAWVTARRRALPAPGDVLAALGPLAAASLSVVYAFAALAKLNSAFVDPATSCAGPLSRQVTWWHPGLFHGTWEVVAAIWATVAVETALAALLLWRRTRAAAVVLGCGFHAVLAVAGNVPFSALAGALYVPLLAPDAVQHLPGPLRALAATGSPRRGGRWLAGAAGAWLLGAALGPARAFHGLRGVPAVTGSPLLGDAGRLAAVAVLAAVGVAAARSPGTARWLRGAPGPVGGRHPVLMATVALLALNGACPYLGLKTDTSFEMFSGLRTEPGAWNSLVVPEAVRVFGYQDGALRVIASDDPVLLARTSAGTRLVPFELERFLRDHPGVRATVTTGRGDPTVLGPLTGGSTVAEGLATFYDVGPPGRGRC